MPADEALVAAAGRDDAAAGAENADPEAGDGEHGAETGEEVDDPAPGLGELAEGVRVEPVGDGGEIIEHAFAAVAVAHDLAGGGRDVELGAGGIAEGDVVERAVGVERGGDGPLVGLDEAEVDR